MRTVAVNDSELNGILEQVADGGPVPLTEDGRLAAVVLSRQAYDELLLAVSADARCDLADMAQQTRREVAQAGLDRSVVDEVIDAVRARHRASQTIEAVLAEDRGVRAWSSTRCAA